MKYPCIDKIGPELEDLNCSNAEWWPGPLHPISSPTTARLNIAVHISYYPPGIIINGIYLTFSDHLEYSGSLVID